jgi:hypothetical protein
LELGLQEKLHQQSATFFSGRRNEPVKGARLNQGERDALF